MKNRNWSLIAIAMTLLALAYCENNYFGGFLERNSSNTPDNVDTTPIPVPPGGDPNLTYEEVTASWTDVGVLGEVRPEILFVMDTSGSMNDEKNALIAALEQWLTQIQSAGIESFCVDIMESAHNSTTTGRLRSASGNDKCLCTDTLTISEIATKFGQNANSITFGGGSSEAGIYSLHQALTDPAKIAANQADGCFRADSALTVVMISDENDQGYVVRDPTDMGCSGNVVRSDGSTVAWNTVDWDNSNIPLLDGVFVTSPATASKYVENNCFEAEIRMKYYSYPFTTGGKYKMKVTAESVAQELLDYNDAAPTFGTSLIYNTTTFLVSSAESQGWGLFEFAEALGQDTKNLATASNQSQFNAQLNEIGEAMVASLTNKYKYDLVPEVCEGQEDSLEVRVNGTLISSTKYDLNSLGTWLKFKPTFNWAPYGVQPDVSIVYTSCN